MMSFARGRDFPNEILKNNLVQELLRNIPICDGERARNTFNTFINFEEQRT